MDTPVNDDSPLTVHAAAAHSTVSGEATATEDSTSANMQTKHRNLSAEHDGQHEDGAIGKNAEGVCDPPPQGDSDTVPDGQPIMESLPLKPASTPRPPPEGYKCPHGNTIWNFCSTCRDLFNGVCNGPEYFDGDECPKGAKASESISTSTRNEAGIALKVDRTARAALSPGARAEARKAQAYTAADARWAKVRPPGAPAHGSFPWCMEQVKTEHPGVDHSWARVLAKRLYRAEAKKLKEAEAEQQVVKKQKVEAVKSPQTDTEVCTEPPCKKYRLVVKQPPQLLGSVSTSSTSSPRPTPIVQSSKGRATIIAVSTLDVQASTPGEAVA